MNLSGIHFYNSNDEEAIQTDLSEQLGTLLGTMCTI